MRRLDWRGNNLLPSGMKCFKEVVKQSALVY
jgi:hypothetical protein